MSNSEEIFYMTQGSRNPPLKAYLRDADGNVPTSDLINANSQGTLKFYMRTQHGLTVVADDMPAILVNSATGEVWYEWSDVDIDVIEEGDYLAKFHITVNNKQSFYPQKDHIKVIVSKK
jgi:hypothetical protein